MSAAEIEDLLHQARISRTSGSLGIAEEALAAAAALDGPAPLRIRARWKWSKALADLDRTEDALRALQGSELPLFDGYPQAYRGARRLARLHQERHGYASAALPWMWSALLEATRPLGDPDAMELVLLDRAWCHGCRGDQDAMEEDLDRVEQHESSARYTRLCVANWALDGSVAREAAAELDPGPVHVETALAEAALRFGYPAPPATGRTPYLRALAAGHGFAPLIQTLSVQGPEFVLAAHQSAVLAGELGPPEETWGCSIFSFVE